MGKLHTLRRAIQRAPEKWRGKRFGGGWYACGASFWRGQWHPRSFYGRPSYNAFVKSVLEDIDSGRQRRQETHPVVHDGSGVIANDNADSGLG